MLAIEKHACLFCKINTEIPILRLSRQLTVSNSDKSPLIDVFARMGLCNNNGTYIQTLKHDIKGFNTIWYYKAKCSRLILWRNQDMGIIKYWRRMKLKISLNVTLKISLFLCINYFVRCFIFFFNFKKRCWNYYVIVSAMYILFFALYKPLEQTTIDVLPIFSRSFCSNEDHIVWVYQRLVLFVSRSYISSHCLW